MATITRQEAEVFFAEIIEVKVKSEVQKRLKDEIANVYKEVDRRLTELAALHGVAIASAGPTWYRNIKYPDGAATSKALRLHVRETPNATASPRASLDFGTLLPVAGTQLVGQSLWLQLADGATAYGKDLQGFWVQATLDDGTIECAEVKGEGRPEPAEYTGQTFGRFYTEGFDGPRDAVVLSASGQALWPMLNLTCMLRGIAMAAVFEKEWADRSEGLATWVPYYAVNVYRFGLAGRNKHMYVTVKPTANWRRYAGPQGTWVPDAENVKGDIDQAQYCECDWLFGMSRELGFQWEDITFGTALSFLRAQGKWTEEQCIEESLLELERSHKDFQTLDHDEMERVFFAQLFSAEEAFGFADLQAELGVDPADRRAARDPENPVPWPSLPTPKPEQAARARRFLQDMLQIWICSKESFLKTLRDLNMEPEDLTDIDVLTNRDRSVLHAASRKGECQVLRAVLDKLRQSQVLREWLILRDQQHQTPLHAALGAQHADATAILLKELTDSKQLGKLLAMVDMPGQSPMHLAASGGNTEAIQSFLAVRDLSWVTSDLLSQQNVEGKTLLDLCQRQESVLTAVLSKWIRFKEARHWLVLRLDTVRTSADAAQADYLGRLLLEPDSQGRKLISSFPGAELQEALHAVAGAGIRSGSLHGFHGLFSEAAKENDEVLTEQLLQVAEAKKVLEDLALHAPTEGLSRLLDYGVRKPNDMIVDKVLDKSRAEGCLQEVLHDLVVNGTQDALGELLRQGFATTTLAGMPAAFKLQQLLDDALLGQMLVTLHAGGGLAFLSEVLSRSTSPELWGRLLRAQFTDRTILGLLLEKLLQLLQTAMTCDKLVEVFTCTVGIASIDTLSVLLDTLVKLKKGLPALFLEAVQAAGRFQEVVQTISKSQLCNWVEKLLLGNHKDMAGFIVALRAAHRLEEVVTASEGEDLCQLLVCLDSAGDDENLGHLVEMVAQAGSASQLCNLVKELLFRDWPLGPTYPTFQESKILAGIMVALLKAARFEEVVTASRGCDLCQFLGCLDDAGDDENLSHFVETVLYRSPL